MTSPAPAGGRPVSAEFERGKPGQPPKPGDKQPGGLKAAWKKNPAAIVATAGVGGVVLFALSKKNSAGSATGGYSDPATNPGAALPTYDSSASDMYNSLEEQLGNLSSQIATITTGTIPTTPTTPSTPKPKPKYPAGPFSYEKTSRNLNTVPEIARHYHLSSATVLRYNPQFAQKGYDVHGLPVNIQYRIPAVK